MRIKIEPGTALGRVKAPSSKSLVHRALICAALSGKRACVKNAGAGEDVRATLGCLRALGFDFAERDGSVYFTGKRTEPEKNPILDCGESGSTLRFIIPTALALCGEARIRGSERLFQRGIGLYEELFEKKGITVIKTADELKISGRLKSGEYTLRGDVSSQYISGLLMALPLLEGDSTVNVTGPIESRGYIDMTLEVMRRFGVKISEKHTGCFLVPGSQCYGGREYEPEGDWSGAAFLYALNVSGGSVSIDGLNDESTQPDRICLELFEKIKRGESVDIAQCPDLGPVLMSVCAVCGGGRLTGTRRLRLKESDRAKAMAQELLKFGVRSNIEENAVTVLPGKLSKPKEALCSHNDHRVVMALAVCAAVTGAEIEGCEAAAKSYPDFFDALEELGIRSEEK